MASSPHPDPSGRGDTSTVRAPRTGVSTDSEIARYPPGTGVDRESRLSAVAAGAGPAGQGTANSPEASLSAVAAGTIVDTGIISMDRYQGPILLSPST